MKPRLSGIAKAARQVTTKAWHAVHGVEHNRSGCVNRQGEGRGTYKRSPRKKRIRR